MLIPSSFELQVITDVVGAVRLELTNLAVADFKSAAYANSATPPINTAKGVDSIMIAEYASLCGYCVMLYYLAASNCHSSVAQWQSNRLLTDLL